MLEVTMPTPYKQFAITTPIANTKGVFLLKIFQRGVTINPVARALRGKCRRRISHVIELLYQLICALLQ